MKMIWGLSIPLSSIPKYCIVRGYLFLEQFIQKTTYSKVPGTSYKLKENIALTQHRDLEKENLLIQNN